MEYLLTESGENLFMQSLKLVWEEYEDVLKDNNMVLLWFSVLGWLYMRDKRRASVQYLLIKTQCT